MSVERRRLDERLAPTSITKAYRIIFTRHAETPLGVAPAPSRFNDGVSGFGVLYAAADIETAVLEVVIRDRYQRRKARPLPVWNLTDRELVQLSSRTEALQLLDLRGDGCMKLAIPTDTAHARNHAAGRAVSREIYRDHPDIDGFLFASRLSGRDGYAIFDRALSKLAHDDVIWLPFVPELPAILKSHSVTLVRPDENERSQDRWC